MEVGLFAVFATPPRCATMPGRGRGLGCYDHTQPQSAATVCPMADLPGMLPFMVPEGDGPCRAARSAD